jgi:hypothetical protein
MFNDNADLFNFHLNMLMCHMILFTYHFIMFKEQVNFSGLHINMLNDTFDAFDVSNYV